MTRPPTTLVRGEALGHLASIPGENVFDGLVTDPPYSSGGMVRGDRMARPTTKYQQTGQELDRGEFTGDNRDQRGYLAWCALWLWECHRLLKPGAPVVLFSDWRQVPITTDALQAGGFVWRGLAVWDKTDKCRPMLGRFRSQAEYLVWGSKGPTNDEDAARVGVLPGVFRVPIRLDDKFHLTGKPSELMEQVCRIVVPGGVVLDPFAGSGSTGVGAVRAGRGFYGIEVQPDHAEMAEKRLSDVSARVSRTETLFLPNLAGG